jgi:tetratricopeptide (TPR) repeat protein
VAALAEGSLLLDGLGSHHRAVTASAEAERWFDQGLRLAYGFNHDEAARSFARGAVVDPKCAMCFWGAALTMGPNYNMGMLPSAARPAWDALQRARDPAAMTTAVERALIGALAARYKAPGAVGPPSTDSLNVAYAAAMKDVAKEFPSDDDVQVLAAEAAMDVRPWELWALDGTPAAGTDWIVSTLETVLARNANHPGANHYYIHAMEASRHPESALPSAERLAELIPGAGHIVHMPSHIYQRVGRYADASATNVKAIEIDIAYLKKMTPPGRYPMYLAHNYGFLSFSASMEGRSAVAIEAARSSAKALPASMRDGMMRAMDFFSAEPILAMVRFGKWDDLLAEPKPEADHPIMTGFWLHGHGMALAAKGKLKDAHADLDALRTMADDVSADMWIGNNHAKAVYSLAAKILAARIAGVEGRPNALSLWDEAVRLSDGLAYSEPDDWYYSVRTFQGAALLAAGKAREAEAVYRDDLARKPNNGFSLFGLWKSLEAQKKTPEANRARASFESAWTNADVKLTASAF